MLSTPKISLRLQNTTKNTLIVGTSYAARAIATFSVVVLIGRFAGPSILGDYSFAINFATAGAFLADAGLRLLLVRRISLDPSKSSAFVSNTFALALVLNLIFGLIIISWAIYGIDNVARTQTVFLSALALTLYSFTVLLNAAFQAHNKMVYDAYSTIIQEAIFTTSTVLCLLVSTNIVYILIGYCISRFCGLIISIYFYQTYLQRFSLQLDTALIKSLAIEAVPYTLTVFLDVLYTRSAFLILTYSRGTYDTGLFEAAYNVTIRLSIFVHVINTVLLPQLSKFQKGNHTANLMTAASIRIVASIGFLFSIWFTTGGSSLLGRFYGGEFDELSIAILIIGSVTGFKFVGAILANALTAAGHQNQRTVVVFFAAAINLLLNFSLIPEYGFYGASIATIITELVLFVGFCIFYFRNNLVVLAESQFILITIIAIICAGCTYTLGFESPIKSLSLATSTFVLGLLTLHYLRPPRFTALNKM